MFFAKITADNLKGGDHDIMWHFSKEIAKRFEVYKVIIDDAVHLKGCRLSQGSRGEVKMSMHEYMEALRSIEVIKYRCRNTTK